VVSDLVANDKDKRGTLQNQSSVYQWRSREISFNGRNRSETTDEPTMREGEKRE